jgi:hypothetical protein
MADDRPSLAEMHANTYNLARYCVEYFEGDPASAVASLIEVLSEYLKLTDKDPAESYADVCMMLKKFMELKTNNFIGVEDVRES